MTASLKEVVALTHAGRLAEAEQLCRARLAQRPRDVDWLQAMGVVLVQRGQFEAALRPLNKALKERPDHAPSVNAKGVALERLKRPAEAAQCYRQALKSMPSSADIWFNLGNACRHAGDDAGALQAYAEAVERMPGRIQFLSALVGIKQRLADWDGLDVLTARLVQALAAGSEAVDPFRALALDTTEAVHQTIARRWASRLKTGHLAGPAVRKDKLTVGYLSADLHAHATAYLMAEFFELHDRSQFSVNAYSLSPDDGSAIRGRLVAAFDSFVDCTGLSALDVAKRIAADGVDILVDLKGYTRDSLPQVTALRPAPVQMQWIGQPGTMGASFVDYVLADGTVLPPSSQPFYDEAIIRLPGCYQVNDRKRVLPVSAPSRAAVGLPGQGVVMACFNAVYKLRPVEFALWMRLLGRVDGAVLWLYCDDAVAGDNLRAAAKSHGIAPERLVFAPHADLAEHLARYRHVDLFLDTLPYNAHTTASDALWMGCPVVTRMGDTFAGRVGASLLKAVGLERLITHSAEEYEATALRLLQDPAERQAIRDHLEQNRLSLPLFDTPTATRAVERAYQAAWARAVAGLTPQPFSVD